MSDTLNSESAGDTPSPPPAFPPPVPGDAPKAASSRVVGLLTLLALTGLAIGVIMTILWLGSKGETDDAIAERDLVTAERDAANQSLTETQTELESTNDVLATTQQVLESAQSDLATAAGDSEEADEPVDAPDNSAAVTELEARITELEADAAEAATENARLEEELEAATSAGPDDPSEDLATGAEFDAATTPGFARYIGELLSSSSGSSRLNATDATCFGGTVIAKIGVEGIGTGQNNAATGADRQIVIDAMIESAADCGIDQSLIF